MLAGAVCKGGNALDALLLGLSTVAETAAAELGRKAGHGVGFTVAVESLIFHCNLQPTGSLHEPGSGQRR